MLMSQIARCDSGEVIAVLLVLGQRGVPALLPAFLARLVQLPLVGEEQARGEAQAGEELGLGEDHGCWFA